MTEDYRAITEHFVTVDGLRLRYLEMGQGPAVLFLHGGSLGSSADVFRRNLKAFAGHGFRAIAFDQPGFGGSDVPQDLSGAYRRRSIPAFMDALGLERAALVAHSQSGSPAVQLALQNPERYTHIIVLGTGSLLPPLVAAKEGIEAVAQQRLERRMAQAEPSLADTRKLLEANLYHHELITDEELALRHSQSIGKNFAAFVARGQMAEAPKKEGTPLWQRLIEVQVPLLLIFGKNDRANAFERATHLHEVVPQLDLHIVENCKHMVPWDAAEAIERLCVPFLKA